MLILYSVIYIYKVPEFVPFAATGLAKGTAHRFTETVFFFNTEQSSSFFLVSTYIIPTNTGVFDKASSM